MWKTPFALASTCCALAAAAPSLADAPMRWSDRGVFVFGKVSMDFRHERITDGGQAFRLTDCSNSEFFCARSDMLSVVLPRNCKPNLSVGDAWKLEGITTRVVGVTAEPATGHLAVRGRSLYFLSTDQRPRVTFVYANDGRGVLHILYDPTIPLAANRDTRNPAARTGEVQPLVTMDTFGGCDIPRRPRPGAPAPPGGGP